MEWSLKIAHYSWWKLQLLSYLDRARDSVNEIQISKRAATADMISRWNDPQCHQWITPVRESVLKLHPHSMIQSFFERLGKRELHTLSSPQARSRYLRRGIDCSKEGSAGIDCFLHDTWGSPAKQKWSGSFGPLSRNAKLREAIQFWQHGRVVCLVVNLLYRGFLPNCIVMTN